MTSDLLIVELMFNAWWKTCPDLELDLAKQAFADYLYDLVNGLYED